MYVLYTTRSVVNATVRLTTYVGRQAEIYSTYSSSSTNILYAFLDAEPEEQRDRVTRVTLDTSTLRRERERERIQYLLRLKHFACIHTAWV